MKPTLDYWLNKLFYDLHTDRTLADRYRESRGEILSRYPLSEAVLDALARDDVAYLAGLTNGFLLRYYFLVVGMAEQDFIAALQSLRKAAISELRNG